MTQVDILTQNGVYKITNTINGKIHIGSAAGSSGFQRRWEKGYNKYLTNAFLKYGTDNFKIEILQICQPQFRSACEQVYLDYYKPRNESDGGYNICKITNLY
jgi:group I intron endonuclease